MLRHLIYSSIFQENLFESEESQASEVFQRQANSSIRSTAASSVASDLSSKPPSVDQSIMDDLEPSISSGRQSPASPSPSDHCTLRNQTIRAEIIAAMNCLDQGHSCSSYVDFAETLSAMFPDSQIAKSMQLGPAKIVHMVAYGLAPYFKEKLIAEISSSPVSVVCFSEAMNKVSQKRQLDLFVQFWDNKHQQVNARYLTSMFLEHSPVENLLEIFEDGTQEIDQRKILQVTADGPSITHEFLDDLKEQRQADPSDPGLLDIGACGLHVIHGAFKAGHDKTGWNLDSFLRSLYYLFKDSPFRRANFIAITGCELFPKKFCGRRWLENCCVVERALEILPHVKTYVEEVEQKPDVESFADVSEAIGDSFFEAKLEFFKSVAMQFEPFLEKLQSQGPLAPLLFDQLSSILRGLLQRIVKKKAMNEIKTAKDLLTMGLNSSKTAWSKKSKFKPFEQTDIGFGAKWKIPKEASEFQRLEFRATCKAFLVDTIKKLVERSPLKYSLVRGLSAIDPGTIMASTSTAQKRFDIALENLLMANRITSTNADKAQAEFASLCTSTAIIGKINSFTESKRLDTFWYELIGADDNYKNVWKCIQMLLVLSHGNAIVEREFSVNESLLVENLQDQTLVAQRLVSDAIKTAGGVFKVQIDKNMIKHIDLSRHRYEQAVGNWHRKEMAATAQAGKRKKRALELSQLEKELRGVDDDPRPKWAAL